MKTLTIITVAKVIENWEVFVPDGVDVTEDNWQALINSPHSHCLSGAVVSSIPCMGWVTDEETGAEHVITDMIARTMARKHEEAPA